MNQESVAGDPRPRDIARPRLHVRRSEAGLVLESKFPAYAHSPDMERRKYARSRFDVLFRSVLDAVAVVAVAVI